MIPFLITTSSFLNFAFYIYAIGFVVALILEQVVRPTGNERNIFIVETNRKYLWKQTWVINVLWFFTNISLYLASRNAQPVDNFWQGMQNISVKKVWRVWAKALGEKSGKSNKEADTIAKIRTFIFVQLVITNCFIVAGNIRHWNDHYTPPHYEHICDRPLPL